MLSFISCMNPIIWLKASRIMLTSDSRLAANPHDLGNILTVALTSLATVNPTVSTVRCQ